MAPTQTDSKSTTKKASLAARGAAKLRRGAQTVLHKGLLRYVLALGATLRKTHRSRWATVAERVPTWDSRNLVVASLVAEGSSVVDVGAGAQTLRKHIKGLVKYTPCDLFKNTPDTHIIDFNEGVYPTGIEQHDYVICSGVLEYVRDPEPFVRFLKASGKTMVLTYNVRLPKDSTIDRLAKDWVNHFSAEELRALLQAHGLKQVREIKSHPEIPQETVYLVERI